MNRSERLMATLQGQVVDRPPVCFYELNGLDEQPDNHDPFNIYTHPSWAPLIELTRKRTDRIVMRSVAFKNTPPDPVETLTNVRTWIADSSLYRQTSIVAGRHRLTATTRRDQEINTVWQIEPLLKTREDLLFWLDLPGQEFGGKPDISPLLSVEAELGDTGILMIDTADPLCMAAELFDLATYLILAETEPQLFHRLMERNAAILYPRTEAIARALPGRLWRIYGPEYASPPFLSPARFREYVVRYDTPLVQSVQRYGGYARLHAHGRLKAILDDIISTGCAGLDPIEPPPLGDVQLGYVREKYGEQLVLFGNLEVRDIEHMPTPEFERQVIRALREGTSGEGRGFVLMPASCPFGRILPPLALRNYQKMVDIVERFNIA